MKNKTIILLTIFIFIFISCSPKKIDNSENQLYSWKDLPKNVFFERKNIQKFTNKKNQNYYYEIVLITSANIDWSQASFLAKDAGGYLLSITSKEESDFIHNLVSDKSWQNINWVKNTENNKTNMETYGKEKSPENVYGFIIEYKSKPI